jgi:hypothetical protein
MTELRKHHHAFTQKAKGSNEPALKSMHDIKKKSSTWVEQIFATKGLTSADRSNKATLLLTVPRSIQVVYKGFTPAHVSFCATWTSIFSFSAKET